MSTTGGGALSFLNQGTTPAAGSSTTTSSTSLPSWYTDYTSQILNKAAQFANQPYQTYQGPRIAAQDPNTTAAYGAAAGIDQTASGTNTTAQNLIQQGANNNNPLGTAQPYLNSGASDINSSVAPGQGGAAAAAPYLSNESNLATSSIAPGQGGLAAAQPYLSSAATPTYDTVGNYMNPYNTAVTGAIANAANTNFNQNTMPAMQSSIIGAGNITGSSTEGTNLIQNAEQQNEQNITNAQSAALQSGYQGAQTAAQSAAALQGSLGSTAGALGTQGQTAIQNAAGIQGNVASTAGSLGNAQQSALQSAGNSLAAIGTSSGQLNSAGTQNSINAGTAASNAGTQATANELAASQNQNTLGQQNQGYNQSNLNLAYQDYLNQLNYPMTQVADMQGALSGIQVPTGNTSSSYGTSIPSTTGTSPLGALTGTGTGTAAAGAGTTNTTPTTTTQNPYLTTTLP